MRFEVDDGHKVLNDLVQVYRGLELADASEAETRFKVIDAILKKVLGWLDDDIVPEDRVANDGKTAYLDYYIKTTAESLVVEAKKARSFVLPSNKKAGLLRGFLSEGDVGDAIQQARDYCIARSAQFAVVTNGSAWVVFPAFRADGVPIGETQAVIFRSLEDIQTRFVEFWELLSRQRVVEGSLFAHFFSTPSVEQSRRPLTLLSDSAFKISRNNLYPYLEKAIVLAFTDDGLQSDPNALEFCYVMNSERTKFDSRLQMHLLDTKPALNHTSVRVRASRKENFFDKAILESAKRLPRFFLILGPVGAGKTTFLQFTQQVSAKEAINQKILWLKVDFKKATKEDNPREFIYTELLEAIGKDTNFHLGHWAKSVEPAYKELTESLRTGPLYLIAINDPVEFDKRIAERINEEFQKVEPYVDRILKYSSTQRPGYLVIDNVDQIEDEDLQSDIFSEAQALAQRLGLNVVMALRESTYLRGKHSARFDAFQFESIYIDPPSVLPVFSRRLEFARKLLEGESADISAANGTHIRVDDLGVFFELVASSILSDEAAFLFEVLSANNIRRGLNLIKEFLSSGHLTADGAIKAYLTDKRFRFSYHEVFKGAVLGDRKFYRDEESLIPNLYCSKLGKRNLQLLRHRLLYFFVAHASDSAYEGTTLADLREPLAQMGVNPDDVSRVINRLINNDLIRVVDSRPFSESSPLYPTRLAGYLLQVLGTRFGFAEMCMLDASIHDDSTWEKIVTLTAQIKAESNIVNKIKFRIERVQTFFDYLKGIEEHWVVEANRRNLPQVWCQQVLMGNTIPALSNDFDEVLKSAERKELRQSGYRSELIQ